MLLDHSERANFCVLKYIYFGFCTYVGHSPTQNEILYHIDRSFELLVYTQKRLCPEKDIKIFFNVSFALLKSFVFINFLQEQNYYISRTNTLFV